MNSNSQKILHVGEPNLPDFDDFCDRLRTIWIAKRLTNDGPMVRELETRIAQMLDVKNCVCVANGTLGLEIVVRALGLVGEVIVPSWTFPATAHAIELAGLTPVFADVKGHHLDPESVETVIHDKTCAIMHVHTWGQAGAIDRLRELARRNRLALICDAAHAFLCTHNENLIGPLGNAEVFSFHATKFFSTVEGGAITTNDDALAEMCRMMRNFGFAGYDSVRCVGTNAKMSEVHAAFGLTMLDCINDVRERNFGTYHTYLEFLGDAMVRYDPVEQSNFQYVVVEMNNRDAVLGTLWNMGVRARKYFFPGVHRMFPYSIKMVDLPVTDELARRTLCLPTGQSVTKDDVAKICHVIKEVSCQ